MSHHQHQPVASLISLSHPPVVLVVVLVVVVVVVVVRALFFYVSYTLFGRLGDHVILLYSDKC